MPDFPIVDSHVHLYDVKRLRYGWLKNVPKIDRTYLLADFDRARDKVAVDKLVFAEVWVDPGLHLQEAAFVQEMADADPRLCGMVAHLPIEKGTAIESDLIALKKHKSLRGIRRLIEIESNPTFCLEPDFIAGVKLVGKHGLRGPWWSQMRELAKLPNVVCKVSGVITEADHGAWTKEQVKPYVAHAIECFGFDRVLYGSDWTVSELTHLYPTWVEILDEVVSGASKADVRKLYRDNAIRIYRLPA